MQMADIQRLKGLWRHMNKWLVSQQALINH